MMRVRDWSDWLAPWTRPCSEGEAAAETSPPKAGSKSPLPRA